MSPSRPSIASLSLFAGFVASALAGTGCSADITPLPDASASDAAANDVVIDATRADAPVDVPPRMGTDHGTMIPTGSPPPMPPAPPANAACPMGFTMCGASCVHTGSDNAHCGDCTTTCASGTGCLDGHCVAATVYPTGPASCAAGGPPIRIGGFTGSTERCVGEIAQVTFRWGMCSCEDTSAAGSLYVDGFDSAVGGYVPGGLGGGVGSNRSYSTAGMVDIRGAFWSGEDISVSGNVYVGQELHAARSIGGSFTVAGDAYVNGSVSQGYFANVLRVPDSADVGPGVSYGSLARGPVSTPPPCDCSAARAIPVASIIDHHRTDNDNASIGLDPTMLSLYYPAYRLELPCGRYYFTEIVAAHTIVIRHPTAIFVDGDVGGAGNLQIVTEGEGELDLFVRGRLGGAVNLVIGSIQHPSRTRVYVASTQGVSFGGYSVIGANVYSPNGPVNFAGGLAMFGGVFAKDAHWAGDLALHYDTDVLRQGAPCGPPPSGCTSCSDCGNQACIDGACGACRSNADCCAPLECSKGTCVAVPE